MEGPNKHQKEPSIYQNFTSSTVLPTDGRDFHIEPCGGLPGKLLTKIRKCVVYEVKRNSAIASISFKLIIGACICVYLAFMFKNFAETGAHVEWVYGYGKAFIYLGFFLWCLIYYKCFKKYIVKLILFFGETSLYLNYRKYMRYSICLVLAILILAFVIYDAQTYPRRLVSLLGIFFFLLVSFLFSKHPDYIRWDIVSSGIILQLLIGIMAIRWDTGRNIIKGFADNIVIFLNYGLDGALFVYGDFLVSQQMVFAFQALSSLYFVSVVTRILHHLGWMQKFCFIVGGFIEYLMGTTVIESVYAATIIFLGQSEAPLLCAPYIELLTASEIHSLMSAGHSTIDASLFATYARMGIDPRYVVTASTMAAPASLCFSKLLYPENTLSRTSSDMIEELKSEDSSVVDAACKGAMEAVSIVHAIIASVIACIAVISFANGTCCWLGALVGVEGITLEWLVGQIFVPVAWLMGVIPEECSAVGKLIGIKTMANEFVAYQELGNLKKMGKISARSEAIATFALCAFANPGALGTNIATLVALAPSRSECINKVAVRAFVTGCITTFTSACIAGLLTQEEGIRQPIL